jgi:hypothetical protein
MAICTDVLYKNKVMLWLEKYSHLFIHAKLSCHLLNPPGREAPEIRL